MGGKGNPNTFGQKEVTPRSAKNKGRRLQQEVRDAILKVFGWALTPDDVKSTSMGAGGEDIQLSSNARRLVPLSIECKYVEKIDIWGAVKQAEDNAGEHLPAVAFRKNNRQTHIALPLEVFLNILELANAKIGNCRDSLNVDRERPHDLAQASGAADYRSRNRKRETGDNFG